MFGRWHVLTVSTLLAASLAVATPASAGRYADIVVDVASGKVLHAEDADGLRYPASLTKMMTLYLAFEDLKAGKLRLNQALTVTQHAATQSPSIIGLKPGEEISVEEAIYATAIKSANDAAMVLAENISGSEAAFAQRMTAKARQLGMRNTTFRNPNGLPNPGQRTTARDMATLALALLRDHPNRYHYFSTASFEFDGRIVNSHNRLNAWYDGADGIKTGFINASGFNIVTSAKRDDRRLVGVVFGGVTASARDRRMAELLDAGFRGNRGFPDIQMANMKMPSLIGSANAATVPAAIDVKPAPVARAAVATTPRTSVAAATEGAWAVQVGAFVQQAQAARQIELAQKAAPALRDEKTAIMPVRAGKKDMLRARFVNLTESDARDACRTLDKRGLTCAVLPPSAARL